MSEFWEPIALFCGGIVTTGILMMVRGDFLGARAATEVEARLNTRIDREMKLIAVDVHEIKQSIVRLAGRK